MKKAARRGRRTLRSDLFTVHRPFQTVLSRRLFFQWKNQPILPEKPSAAAAVSAVAADFIF